MAEEPAPVPIVLWQGLSVGMTPEEALAAVSAVEGVKSAKVRGRPEAVDRLQINHTSQKIVIAAVPFELSPRFENNKLKEVWLTAADQCSAKAVDVFQKLSMGLTTKYPQHIGPTQELTELEVARANSRARESGKPDGAAFAFASETVAVGMVFRFDVAVPPPYPIGGGKLGASLWRLGRTMYDQRTAECDGTGDRRMGIALRYMARSAFDAMIDEGIKKTSADQKLTADKL
ncbi:hypothetical protein [Novosphingobium sp. Gsoil 351]|uniref:hypothetical protein n=1 Tax=Novosphingobium sp. Gsoil 351 TaxID=2675225 RepID=UPI0012B4BF33|nr:hypothetical protein [Novosphingobium sp. Gsoil 351]QGN55013.1 hypothetical protein GKE62_11050 [Novosphingobium sp. Gsoil 351]